MEFPGQKLQSEKAQLFNRLLQVLTIQRNSTKLEISILRVSKGKPEEIHTFFIDMIGRKSNVHKARHMCQTNAGVRFA